MSTERSRQLSVSSHGNGNCLSSSGGEKLWKYEFLVDSSNRHGMMFTITGDVCTFQADPSTLTDKITWNWNWCLGIGNVDASYAYVDNEGYLRLVTSAGKTYWRSQFAAGSDGMLLMKTDGNLVLYNSVDESDIWACGGTSLYAGYISFPNFASQFLAYSSRRCPIYTAVTAETMVCKAGVQSSGSSAATFQVNTVAVTVVGVIFGSVIVFTMFYALWTWIMSKRKERYDAEMEHAPYKSFRRSTVLRRTSDPPAFVPGRPFFGQHSTPGVTPPSVNHNYQVVAPSSSNNFAAGTMHATSHFFHNSSSSSAVVPTNEPLDEVDRHSLTRHHSLHRDAHHHPDGAPISVHHDANTIEDGHSGTIKSFVNGSTKNVTLAVEHLDTSSV